MACGTARMGIAWPTASSTAVGALVVVLGPPELTLTGSDGCGVAWRTAIATSSAQTLSLATHLHGIAWAWQKEATGQVPLWRARRLRPGSWLWTPGSGVATAGGVRAGPEGRAQGPAVEPLLVQATCTCRMMVTRGMDHMKCLMLTVRPPAVGRRGHVVRCVRAG